MVVQRFFGEVAFFLGEEQQISFSGREEEVELWFFVTIVTIEDLEAQLDCF
jgi:hypothetical protein